MQDIGQGTDFGVFGSFRAEFLVVTWVQDIGQGTDFGVFGSYRRPSGSLPNLSKRSIQYTSRPILSSKYAYGAFSLGDNVERQSRYSRAAVALQSRYSRATVSLHLGDKAERL